MTLDAHEQLGSGKQLSTITILVTDQHAPLIDSLLTRSRWSRGVVYEVYSVTGLPTFCWRNTAYFPAHLAELLLARAVVHPSGAMVPFLEDQFRSLAFHALYHDGYDSDLPADRAAYGDGPLEGNRYASELGRLARELGLHIPLTKGCIAAAGAAEYAHVAWAVQT